MRHTAGREACCERVMNGRRHFTEKQNLSGRSISPATHATRCTNCHHGHGAQVRSTRLSPLEARTRLLGQRPRILQPTLSRTANHPPPEASAQPCLPGRRTPRLTMSPFLERSILCGGWLPFQTEVAQPSWQHVPRVPRRRPAHFVRIVIAVNQKGRSALEHPLIHSGIRWLPDVAARTSQHFG